MIIIIYLMNKKGIIKEEIQYEDIALQFTIKTKDFHLFELFDNNYFMLTSVNHYHKIKCERENNQYLVLYMIDASSFSLTRVIQFEEIKKKCSLLYGNKVKLMLTATSSFGDYETEIFLNSQYDCLFFLYSFIDKKEKLVFIDNNGIIQLISPINQKGAQELQSIDEKYIINNIEKMINSQPLIIGFTKKEVNQYYNEMEKIINSNELEIKNCVIKYLTCEVPGKDITLINIELSFNEISDNTIKLYQLIIEKLNKYIQLGITIETNLHRKPNKLKLTLTYQCYRCKHIIDRSTEYSYLCIKCKNKQYCNKCIKFFDSYKKFGSQLTILKEIEDYNTYINNNIIDDLPCESYHLLMFIPPEMDNTLLQKYSYSIPTYVEYTSPSRHNNKCDFCYELFGDEKYKPNLSYEYDFDEYGDEVLSSKYNDISPDNSLNFLYDEISDKYKLHHYKNVSGYCPVFYCLVCKKYFDWECFIRFNTYIQLNKEDYYNDQYLRYNYDNNIYNKGFSEVKDNPNSKKENKEVEDFLNMINYSDYKKETVQILSKNGEIRKKEYTHRYNHPYIIIQAKGIKISYIDFI